MIFSNHLPLPKFLEQFNLIIKSKQIQNVFIFWNYQLCCQKMWVKYVVAMVVFTMGLFRFTVFFKINFECKASNKFFLHGADSKSAQQNVPPPWSDIVASIQDLSAATSGNNQNMVMNNRYKYIIHQTLIYQTLPLHKVDAKVNQEYLCRLLEALSVHMESHQSCSTQSVVEFG